VPANGQTRLEGKEWHSTSNADIALRGGHTGLREGRTIHAKPRLAGQGRRAELNRRFLDLQCIENVASGIASRFAQELWAYHHALLTEFGLADWDHLGLMNPLFANNCSTKCGAKPNTCLDTKALSGCAWKCSPRATSQ